MNHSATIRRECAGTCPARPRIDDQAEKVSGQGLVEKRSFASASGPPIVWAINPAANLVKARELRRARRHAWSRGWRIAKALCGEANGERVLSDELEPDKMPAAPVCSRCARIIRQREAA